MARRPEQAAAYKYVMVGRQGSFCEGEAYVYINIADVIEVYEEDDENFEVFDVYELGRKVEIVKTPPQPAKYTALEG